MSTASIFRKIEIDVNDFAKAIQEQEKDNKKYKWQEAEEMPKADVNIVFKVIEKKDFYELLEESGAVSLINNSEYIDFGNGYGRLVALDPSKKVTKKELMEAINKDIVGENKDE